MEKNDEKGETYTCAGVSSKTAYARNTILCSTLLTQLSLQEMSFDNTIIKVGLGEPMPGMAI